MQSNPEHSRMDELVASLDDIRRSPRDAGTVQSIVCRPATNERLSLEEGRLDPDEGLVGDCWAARARARSQGEPVNPDRQLTLMNTRAIDCIAGSRDRWQLAGDQLYLDLDLSEANLPAGTRLAMGTSILEITEPPHLGCKKFMARFGPEALEFVNSDQGRGLRLRGAHARIVKSGVVRVGDTVRKL